VLEEGDHEKYEEDAGQHEEESDQSVHELDHPTTGSHPMHHFDDDLVLILSIR